MIEYATMVLDDGPPLISVLMPGLVNFAVNVFLLLMFMMAISYELWCWAFVWEEILS